MYKALAVSFLAAFCFSLSEVQTHDDEHLQCVGCSSVDPYNNCEKNTYVCTTKRSGYCYNRMVSKDGAVLFVDRGCISKCIHVRRDQHYRNLTWCCNNRRFCNTGDITCLLCRNVAADNTCTHKEDTCNPGLWDFCYTRLKSQGSTMISVDRGCTAVCRTIQKSRDQYAEKMLCCVKNGCNSHNFWTNL